MTTFLRLDRTPMGEAVDGAADAVRSLPARLRQAVRRWQRIRTVEQELDDLPDRALAEMYIRRSDIPRIARETVDRTS